MSQQNRVDESHDRGVCGSCGKQPLYSPRYRVRCAERIRERSRIAMLKKLGCKPWQPGKRGRPPIDRDE